MWDAIMREHIKKQGRNVGETPRGKAPYPRADGDFSGVLIARGSSTFHPGEASQRYRSGNVASASARNDTVKLSVTKSLHPASSQTRPSNNHLKKLGD